MSVPMYSIKETPTILSTPFALSDAIVSAHLAFVSFCKAINWSIYESKECVEQRRPFSLEAIMRLQHRDETTTLIIICLALYLSNFNRFRTLAIDTTNSSLKDLLENKWDKDYFPCFQLMN